MTRPLSPRRPGPAVVLLALAAVGPLGGCASDDPARQSSAANTAASANMQLGAAYLQQDNLPIAKDKLERAVIQNPRDPAIHGLLALLYQRLGEDKRVDSEFRTALNLAPRDPDLLNNYAVYLCGKGRYDEGVARFQEAAGNPLYRTPWAADTNAGVCLRRAGRQAEAASLLQRALQRRSDYAEAVSQLADLEISQGHAAEAYQRVDAFMAANPASAELLLLAWRAATALENKINVAQMAWRLQTEFPESDQARRVTATRSAQH
jgi:type IV pilus assembly protein PilF